MVTCPRCGVSNVHSSRASIGEKILLLMVLQKRVRCYDCMHRFSAWIFESVKPRVSRAILAAQKKADAEAAAREEAASSEVHDEAARGTLSPDTSALEIPEQEKTKEEAS